MHGYRCCSTVQHSTQGRDINEINILTAALMLVLDPSCIECETMGISVRRSSPRTAKRPRTGPDWTDLGLDRSPGSTLVLSGPVLVLKVL